MKSDADAEAELLGNSFVAFSHEHDFEPDMIAQERPGCSLLRKSGDRSLVVLELRDG
jgi:hypothetical protein